MRFVFSTLTASGITKKSFVMKGIFKLHKVLSNEENIEICMFNFICVCFCPSVSFGWK